MAHQDWVKRPAPIVCPGPMTRAALLAIRDAGGLSLTCHYQITDFVQGRFLAGTTITLHAVAANELSMAGVLNTLFDNTGWPCVYDIDTNNLVEVQDNIGNVVRSNVVGRVAAWDWGNANVFNNVSHGANVTWTYGSARPVINNTFDAASTVNFTGWAAGSFSDNRVLGGSTVNMTGAGATVAQSQIVSGSQLTLTGYTGGGFTIYRTIIENGASVNLSNSTVQHEIRNSRVSGLASNINSIGVVTAGATFSMSGSEVSAGGQITRSAATVSPMVFNYSRVIGNASSISHLVGSLTCTGVSLQDYGRLLWDAAPGSAVGAAAISYSSISGGAAYARHWGRATMTLSGIEIRGGANVNTAVNSNSVLTVTNTSVRDASSISVLATATGLPVTISGTEIVSSSYINQGGVGQLNVNACFFSGVGRIETLSGNVRNLSVTGVTFSNIGRLQQSAIAGAGVTDTVIYSSVLDYASIVLSATGAAGNAINYCSMRGLTAAINVLGTNTGLALSRTTLDNGVVTFNNNVAMPTILDIGVRDQGVWTVQNCTAARDIRYSTVQSYGRWLFTGCTAASITFGIDLRSQGNLTHSLACTSGLYCTVETGGTVLHNGGSFNGVYKRMGGTLTLGNFAHANIAHEVAVNKTLTAANNNRADYVGLTAQLV